MWQVCNWKEIFIQIQVKKSHLRGLELVLQCPIQFGKGNTKDKHRFFYSQATDWVMEVTCKALNYFQKKWGYEWQKKHHAKEYIVTDPLPIQLIIIANFSMTYLH